MFETDICIIGAGPAGLMAAITAVAAGKKPLLVESNSTAGVKLALTGNGRCNLTHTGTITDFIRAYKPSDKFVRHCLYEFGPTDLRDFFSDCQLETIAESSGCVFPKSNRSSDVKRVLLDELKKLNCKILYGTKIKNAEKNGNHFVLKTDKFDITAKALIIATGGLSWSSTGSTGDGYKFAKSFGHDIIPPLPGLVGLIADDNICRSLAGVSIEKIRLGCKIAGKKVFSFGAMVFTHVGISGPAVLNLSRAIAKKLSKSRIEICIDFLPDLNEEKFAAMLAEHFSGHPKQNIAAAISKFVPKSVAAAICEKNGLTGLTISQISNKNRAVIISDIKAFKLVVKSAESIEKATVTVGGVDICQINPKTMGSKLCSGLFFAGEVLNVDGPCGGYNMQFAFSSGALAAKSAVELLTKIT